MILRNEDTAMSRIKQITKLVSLAGLEIGALAWLLRLGERPWTRIEWANLGRWLRVTPTDDAIAAIVWTMALVGTIWLVGTTLIYVAVRAMRAPTLIRAVASITLPAIRRVSEGALAAILVTTTIAPTPVRADAPPPVVVVVNEDGSLLPPGLVNPEPQTFDEVRPTTEMVVSPLPYLPTEAEGVAADNQPAIVTVQAGDNLWTMSRHHLTAMFNRRPANQEIVPYWRQVIALNQSNLISGDPDLIYPGEVIAMPPTS